MDFFFYFFCHPMCDLWDPCGLCAYLRLGQTIYTGHRMWCKTCSQTSSFTDDLTNRAKGGVGVVLPKGSAAASNKTNCNAK